MVSRSDNPDLALIFVAGLGSDPRNWRQLLSVIPATYASTVAEKIVGSEQESPEYGPGSPKSFAAYFRGIDAAIESTPARTTILVGHSLGCVLSSAYTRYGKHPVDGQVLLAPLVIRQVESFAHPWSYGAKNPGALVQAAYFVLVAGSPVPESIKQRCLTPRWLRSTLFWPVDRQPSHLTKELAIEVTRSRARSNVQSQTANASDYAALEWIPNPVVRTLYVEGERDRLGSISDRKTVEDSPLARLIVLQDAGHWLHMERPSEVWAEIAAFCNLLEPPNAP